MKIVIHIITSICILYIASSCQQQSHPRLDMIECMLVENPDSAYSVLQKLDEESEKFCQKDRMRYGLLRLVCQNTLDLPFDSKDSIAVIVDYYAHHGTYNETLLSNYLQGRSYMVCGNEPMAMECFNKCLVLETPSKGGIDYTQLSKVHSQLDQIYRNQNLPQYEIKELMAAEKYAYLGKDTALATTYDFLKVHPYFKMGVLDSVINITNRARHQYQALGQNNRAAEVLYMTFNAYLQKGEYEKAKQDMRIFESESGVFDSIGNIEPGREIFYFLKGKLLESCGQRDSAEYQYRKLLTYKEDVNNIEAASKGLLSLYRTIGNSDSIGKYADMYCEANDSVHKKSIADNISKMKTMYDYSEYKQKMEIMKNQAESTKTRIRVTILLLSCLFVLLIYGIYTYRKKKQIEIKKLLEEYDRTLQTIEDLNDNKEEMIRCHQSELEEIKKSLLTKGVCVSNKNNKCDIDEMLLNRFHDYGESMGNNATPITSEEWHRLFIEITNHDSKFILLLRESNLSENEKKIAVLIRLHFNEYQIKRILDSYGSSLPNYKARINKKLFNQNSAKTLRRLIYAWE